METENRSGRRVRGLLWAVIAATALALVIILRALWIEFGETSMVPPAVAGGQALSRARAILMPWARSWHTDAGIVSCTTSHKRGATAGEAWTCQVTSQSAQVIALTRVGAQEVALLRETPAIYPQEVLPEAAWQTDSGRALQIWWRDGGQSVWAERGGDTLHLRLGLNDSGVPTWQVSLDTGPSAEMATWEISAELGDVLHAAEEGVSDDVP